MPHDRQLASQINRGEPRAWAAFVDAHGPRLHRLTRRYTACEADAEDLTQEVFVALYRSLPAYRAESSLATWSYRVALNCCLKHAAKSRPVTVPYDDARAEAAPEALSPAHLAAKHELNDHLHSALDGLSPDHRTVVILHELHEMTYAECAAILSVPVGTVKSRLSTAFARLRVSLGGYVLPEPESAL